MNRTTNLANDTEVHSEQNNSLDSLQHESQDKCLHSKVATSDTKTSILSDHTYSSPTRERLKMCTINVCGLKSKLMSPDFEDFIKEYDFICVTETKLDNYDNISLENYSIITNNRSHCKHKSGGVVFIYRAVYSQYVKVVAKSKHALLVTISPNVCGYSLLVVCTYIPPEGSAYSDEDSFLELEQIICDNRGDHEVCILGDFNARTSTIPDYNQPNETLSQISGLTDEVAHLLENGYDLDRYSKDQSRNNYGYRLIDMCKSLRVLILNGRLSNDKYVGKFTCRNASVVDYIIVSPMLFSQVLYFNVAEFCELYSDVHCTVECHVPKTPRMLVEKSSDSPGDNDNSVQKRIEKRPIWRENYRNDFVDNINMNEILSIENEMSFFEQVDSVPADQVQTFCEKFTKVLTECGTSIGSIKANVTKTKSTQKASAETMVQ